MAKRWSWEQQWNAQQLRRDMCCPRLWVRAECIDMPNMQVAKINVDAGYIIVTSTIWYARVISIQTSGSKFFEEQVCLVVLICIEEHDDLKYGMKQSVCKANVTYFDQKQEIDGLRILFCVHWCNIKCYPRVPNMAYHFRRGQCPWRYSLLTRIECWWTLSQLAIHKGPWCVSESHLNCILKSVVPVMFLHHNKRVMGVVSMVVLIGVDILHE